MTNYASYSSYQLAKINNPDKDIYEISGRFETEDSYNSSNFSKSSFKKCNPADYCISIAEFKERGLELSNGDLYELEDAGVFQVGFGDGISVNYNSPVNSERYILRAAALEQPKPTRTKVSYEKVTDSIFDLKEEFERGDLFTKKFNQEWHRIKTEQQLGGLLSMNDDEAKNGIYRRIETPITWQEEVNNHFFKTKLLGIDCTIEEAITRSDYCEEFLEVCRVALRANGELTDKA